MILQAATVRRWRIRIAASAIAGVLCLVVAGCGSKVRLPDGVRQEDLPDLSRLDESAQASLRTASDQVTGFHLKRDETDYTRLGHLQGNWGMQLLAFQLLDRATIAFENARLLAPSEFKWAYCLAHTLRQNGQAESSIAQFEQALKLLPASNQSNRWEEAAHCWIGDLYLQLNKPQKALEHFDLALDAQPRSAYAAFGKGRVAEMQNDEELAVDEYRRALQRTPNAKNIHYALMISLRKMGDVGGAERHQLEFERPAKRLTIVDPLLEEVERLDNSPRANRQRGNEALFNRGDYASAIRYYQLAIDKTKEDPVLHHNFATALAKGGQAELAMKHYEEAVRLRPEFAASHSNLGVMYRAFKKDLDNAIKHLELAHKHDAQDAVTMFELANTLMLVDKLERAAEMYANVLKSEPAHELAILNRAESFRLMGKYDRAKKQLEHGLTVLPDNGAIRKQLVQLLAACPVSEIRDGRRALEVAQQIDEVQYGGLRSESIAIAQAELGQFVDAQRSMQAAIKSATQRGDKERVSFLQRILTEQIEKQMPVRFPE